MDRAETAAALPYWTDDPGNRLSPRTFVGTINVPVFLAGAWQDEQTGPRFATMLDKFTSAPVMELCLYNGAHADSANPMSLGRLFEFMDVHVAHRTPNVDPLIRLGTPALYKGVYGDGLSLPPDRFASLDEANAVLESDKLVHLLLELGGNPDSPGGPTPRAERQFDSWPPPAAQQVSWSLGAGGSLVSPDQAASNSSVESFTVDIAHSQVVTPTAEDADLQVTISEIRPDGQEMFVQSGWLRASHRAPDRSRSTDLLPFQTHTEADVAPLPADEFTQVDMEIFPAPTCSGLGQDSVSSSTTPEAIGSSGSSTCYPTMASRSRLAPEVRLRRRWSVRSARPIRYICRISRQTLPTRANNLTHITTIGAQTGARNQ